MIQGMFLGLVIAWEGSLLEPATIDLAYDFDPEAFRAIRAQAEHLPEDAFAAFLVATVAYWEYLGDRVDVARIRTAQESMERSVALAARDHGMNPDSPDATFLHGLTLCNLSRFHLEQRNWWSAYRRANRGLSMLSGLVKDQPDHHDAWFAIGVAQCFLDDVPLFLRPFAFLMGFRGDAASGLNILERCRDEGYWTRVEGAFYLGYYHFTVTGDGEEGVSIFRDLRARYPGNPVFCYYLGRCLQVTGKPLEAAEVYEGGWPHAIGSGARDLGYEMLFRLGEIRRGEGLQAEALEAFLTLRELVDSGYQEQRYYWILPLRIGEIYHKLGSPDEAREWLMKVSKDGASVREARALLRKLP